MDCTPNFASDGSPRRLRIDVIMSMAIAHMVIVPLAVDFILALSG